MNAHAHCGTRITTEPQSVSVTTAPCLQSCLQLCHTLCLQSTTTIPFFTEVNQEGRWGRWGRLGVGRANGGWEGVELEALWIAVVSYFHDPRMWSDPCIINLLWLFFIILVGLQPQCKIGYSPLVADYDCCGLFFWPNFPITDRLFFLPFHGTQLKCDLTITQSVRSIQF